MILLLISMIFVSRLYGLVFPKLFGHYGDLMTEAKNKANKDNLGSGVSKLANNYMQSYLCDEAFIASFINLIPILIFSYKTNVMTTHWFIIFYTLTILITTLVYTLLNLIREKITVYGIYRPYLFRLITVIIIFFSFFKLYSANF